MINLINKLIITTFFGPTYNTFVTKTVRVIQAKLLSQVFTSSKIPEWFGFPCAALCFRFCIEMRPMASALFLIAVFTVQN